MITRFCFVAKKLGGSDVGELERLATAFYITEQMEKDASPEERAVRLTEVKPHITRDSAVAAVAAVDRVVGEVRVRAF